MQSPMQPRMSIRSPRPVSAAVSRPTSAAPVQGPIRQTPVVRPLAGPAGTTPPSQTRALRLQLEQFKAKYQALENKRKQTLSPVYRQGMETQLKALSQQIQKLTLALLKAQSQERLPLLQALNAGLADTPPAFKLLYEQWQALYPPEIQIWPEASHNQSFASWSAAFGACLLSLDGSAQQQQQISLDLPEALRTASTAILPQELQLWQQLVERLQSFLPPPAPVPQEPEAFELISFADNTSTFPQVVNLDQEEETRIRVAQAQGSELEIRFDMRAGRSLVRNSMGIVLNQHKKTYQEYLDQGFVCIDRVVESGFVNTAPLQQAIEVFLEAISLNKERHEAYFGLGYLYSLVRDLNHSLYFLELAWKISQNPAIQTFMQRVKESYGVS